MTPERPTAEQSVPHADDPRRDLERTQELLDRIDDILSDPALGDRLRQGRPLMRTAGSCRG